VRGEDYLGYSLMRHHAWHALLMLHDHADRMAGTASIAVLAQEL
jgi:hypothetical protein